jgi:O-antigen/teichoic acid export membrane protein
MERPADMLRRPGARQSAILGVAMIAAGGLDYLVYVVAGRWLGPAEFGIFVSVSAVLQVLSLLAGSIRVVVARYTSDLSASGAGASSFLLAAWRWAARWGLGLMLLVAVAGPLLARVLALPDAWAIWAAAPALAAMFPRGIAFGALQGTHRFGTLGVVQVVQAMLRIAFAAGLLAAGWRAGGAILATSLSAAACVLITAWRVRGLFGPRSLRPSLIRLGVRSPSVEPSGGPPPAAVWNYSAASVVGLAVFGLVTNLDALVVRHWFDPETAGAYGPVVTLSRICLFLPTAVGLVLFSKVANRRAMGRDPRAILLAALFASLAPGLVLTAAYFTAPGALVRLVFTGAYPDPGLVLGLAGLAGTLFAGVHIWINYALSLERNRYVWALAVILCAQFGMMWLLGRHSLVGMTAAMVASALAANVAGYLTTWTGSAEPSPAAGLEGSA